MTRQTADPHPSSGARSRPRAKPAAPRSNRRLRLAFFGVITLLVGGVAIGLVAMRLQGPGASDTQAIKVTASMGGFEPNELTTRAGQVVKIDLVDLDTSMHSDGGGVHSFHVDALNVHQKVQPLSDLVFEFAAPATPGTYDFYCDTCCGGKENPAMHGRLTVTS